MTRIEVETEVGLECYIVHAHIYTPRRPYVLPVLLHTERTQGGTDAELLSSDLFPGLKPVGQKLLDICEKEGLVERNERGMYALSDDGKEAIDSGRALVRSPGQMWKIHYADCDLIPQKHRVVRLDAATPNEVGYDPRQNAKNLEIKPLPGHITGLRGNVMAPILGGAPDEFRIDMIAAQGKAAKSDMRMTLTFRLNESGSGASPAKPGGRPVRVSGRFSILSKIGPAESDGDANIHETALSGRDGSVSIDLGNCEDPDWDL